MQIGAPFKTSGAARKACGALRAHCVRGAASVACGAAACVARGRAVHLHMSICRVVLDPRQISCVPSQPHVAGPSGTHAVGRRALGASQSAAAADGAPEQGSGGTCPSLVTA
jgi:hypothetical protein